MKILWSVNIFPPEIASRYGVAGHPISWVSSLSKKLKEIDGIELAMVSPVTGGGSLDGEIIDGITYYPLRKNRNSYDWEMVISSFKPDIVHAFGSEHAHNLSLVKEYGDSLPIIISIQGIIGEIVKHFYAGIEVSTIIKNMTLRDLVRGTLISERREMARRAKLENELFSSAHFVEGRTFWDRVNILKINPDLVYYNCPRMLRAPFYNLPKWKNSAMERHTLFLGQANQPIKGFHIFLEALYFIKRKYPDVKVNIAGSDIYRVSGFKSVLHRKGYQKYVCGLIEKYRLNDSINFLGYLNEKEMAYAMTKANAVVIPSSIENSPNTLAEAMLLGVPCVASYVGGSPEMLTDSVEGYMYNYLESGVLSERVCEIFADDALALSFSEASRAKALQRNDPRKIVEDIQNIYLDVISRFGK